MLQIASNQEQKRNERDGYAGLRRRHRRVGPTQLSQLLQSHPGKEAYSALAFLGAAFLAGALAGFVSDVTSAAASAFFALAADFSSAAAFLAAGFLAGASSLASAGAAFFAAAFFGLAAP